MRELTQLPFVREAANFLVLGPPGVSKTHLALVLGSKAIEAEYGVYFLRAHDLVETSNRTVAEELLIDKFCVWP